MLLLLPLLRPDLLPLPPPPPLLLLALALALAFHRRPGSCMGLLRLRLRWRLGRFWQRSGPSQLCWRDLMQGGRQGWGHRSGTGRCVGRGQWDLRPLTCTCTLLPLLPLLLLLCLGWSVAC